jgi:hypothetical protein
MSSDTDVKQYLVLTHGEAHTNLSARTVIAAVDKY